MSTSKKRALPSSKEEQENEHSKTKADGLNEIDALFSQKKKQKLEQRVQEKQTEKSASRNPKSKLKYDRHDTEALSSPNEFIADGLGGRFNKEGYTGRVEDGVKIYKAHLFNKPSFGNSKDCPFDCDCCYI